MMKKIKNYLLEDCGKTRAYDLYMTGALIAYMIGNYYLSSKLDKVERQKKRLEEDLDYEVKTVALQNNIIDDHQKVIKNLTEKLEEN